MSDENSPSESRPHWVEMMTKDDRPLGPLKIYLKNTDGHYVGKALIKKRTEIGGTWTQIGGTIELPKDKCQWFDLVSMEHGCDAMEYRFECIKTYDYRCD